MSEPARHAATSKSSKRNPLPPATAADALYDIAERRLPGAALGANSLPDDIRFVVRKGEGSRIQDVNGRWYIDYVCGAGALILGHAHPQVTQKIAEQVGNGIHFFGMLNEQSVQLADEVVEAVPCAEKVVFGTTGSEATFYAMRLARAFTGRDAILKFEGGYHGNNDYSNISMTPKAISNYPQGQPDSAGIPAGTQASVLVAPYNDLDAVRLLVAEHKNELAAIIVEPVQRIIYPAPGFLQGLRKIADDYGILLIFDEVVTGFRLAYGGAQELYGVTPDLAAYGKIVGGASALSAVAGRADVLDLSDPRNKSNPKYVHVNGTLHGNPVACAAGLATLAEIRKPGFYDRLNTIGADFRKAMQDVLDRLGVPALVLGEGSLWHILFLTKPPRNYADVLSSDQARTKALDHELVRQGLYVLPNRRFVSAAHTDKDIEETARALDAACRKIK
ncbi:MAG: aminotransferase class III-fold pyridoxal phosphate-dependent enzyme [Rhodospirillales bacterium]|nr:aminotransferase class III-fold pyridoxal phosphate-dependent enzyme [Rhodospirillales bacterium]